MSQLIELSAANAGSYLKERGWDVSEATCRELGGGVSNTVVLVEAPRFRLVLKQSLSRLRVEQEWRSDRRRIFRESEAIRRLAPDLPSGSLPSILFEDGENYLFAMSAAPGDTPNWKSLLLQGRCDPAIAGAIGKMLGTMISTTWMRPEWRTAFGDQTVFDQLRIDPYYRTAARRNPDLRSSFERLITESGERRVSLVHGDWSPKNFLIHGSTPMAIDFEVVHFGDPSFDAGFLLNHLLLKSLYRPQDRTAYANLARRFWEALEGVLPAEASWMENATLQHLGGLLLARVDGKSPAEYIQEPDPVRRLARALITHPPRAIKEVFGW